MASLTTRVKAPDKDDWGKLKRVLKHLCGTHHWKLTLTIDSIAIKKWFIDASFAVHTACKGQSGGMMMLGKGAISSFSRKQKLNVQSSMEGELVGTGEGLDGILWSCYFFEGQGYKVQKYIIFQDNTSAMSLENLPKATGLRASLGQVQYGPGPKNRQIKSDFWHADRSHTRAR